MFECFIILLAVRNVNTRIVSVNDPDSPTTVMQPRKDVETLGCRCEFCDHWIVLNRTLQPCFCQYCNVSFCLYNLLIYFTAPVSRIPHVWTDNTMFIILFWPYLVHVFMFTWLVGFLPELGLWKCIVLYEDIQQWGASFVLLLDSPAYFFLRLYLGI